MGLQDKLQTKMAKAFDGKLADAVRAVSGARVVAGEYDPITGSDTGGSTLNYSGRGVFSSYLAREIDGSLIQTTDEKLLVLQNELFVLLDGAQTAEIAAPAIGDIISGKRVLNVSEDPAMATFTIQLRV
ncbi:hypothetical protein [Pseudomonas lundensis]|uniref:hypothetical protein n=1 Tax=Pseudomonas lundensis TaxID=86185 RepID=UPI00089DBA77|nr:hypothetical protein [Pseudomonas lundensis]